jgi:hypothetical protein
MLAAALAIVVTVGPSLVAVPDEPGAQVLVEGAIYQAVAVDLDGDGVREIVVLTHGDGSTIAASAFQETDAGWRRIGAPLEVVPGATRALRGSARPCGCSSGRSTAPSG